MRISVDKNDPGYNPEYYLVREVLLDGKGVNNCVTADEELDYLEVYVSPHSRDIELLYGKVRILWDTVAYNKRQMRKLGLGRIF